MAVRSETLQRALRCFCLGAFNLLGSEQTEQGDVRECLRPVDDERVTFHARVRARTRKNGVTAIDNERRPEVTRECGRTHAADDELAVVDGGRVGKQLDQGVISRPTSPASLQRRPGRCSVRRSR